MNAEWKFFRPKRSENHGRAAACKSCDMMQPILENLRKKFGERLDVILVDVTEEQMLGALYGINSIPVQVFLIKKE